MSTQTKVSEIQKKLEQMVANSDTVRDFYSLGDYEGIFKWWQRDPTLNYSVVLWAFFVWWNGEIENRLPFL